MIGSSAAAMLEAQQQGQISAEELVSAHLAHIRDRDTEIGAFLEVFGDDALAQAREVDRKRAAGALLGPLAGLPVAIKDNICVQGHHTTCGSRILEDFIAPYSATVIERLREADAIIIGKTNLDEFAMGSSTEFSALRRTRNPVNLDCVPGGSSGGSAAAVAAGMVPLALGSSTGGSIRQPASFCGIVGMKPTYGRVSRYGLVAYGSSLDQIGPMATDVDGTARLMQVIGGFDSRDATSAREDMGDCLSDLNHAPYAPRIGLVREWQHGEIQPEVRAAEEYLIARLRDAGAQFVEISLPHTEYAIPAYYLVATAEASANLARFDGVRYGKRTERAGSLRDMYVRTRSEGFGPEVKRRILLGTYCLSSGYYEGFYLNAQKVRTKIVQDFQAAFGQVDAILSPTTPNPAFRFGEKTDDPVTMYMQDIYTVMANLAGLPAISIPVGKSREGLPLGCQFMAVHFGDAPMLRLARWAESLLH
jgi:aspartyl-tRNA(Asn)/glutamyl-tRNA(Gln) amidotransferase subunit A